MEFQAKDAIQWLNLANEKIQENKDYLTSLDQPIGDGDHGINMARGFQEVVNKLMEQEYENVSDVLKDAAMTIMSKVGGASGPLFGSAFLKFSTAVKDNQTVDKEMFTKGMEEAVAGVKQRGKAESGEKTMIDVWEPVAAYFKEAAEPEADELQSIANEAMEHTKETIATKGRASYFKEKSVGHIDPGSASSFYIFKALAEVLKGDS
ncbi:dihydroxyacetone kinase subunit DhaL [Virgibacillus ainsalahensis]